MRFQELMDAIKRSRTTKGARIGPNTRAIFEPNADVIRIELHGNRIAYVYPDNSLQLYSAGWHTQTTLRRLNGLLVDWPFMVSSIKGKWYIMEYFGIAPQHWIPCADFVEGISISFNGNTFRVV